MLNLSTWLKYPLIVMLSIGKKSFENLGRHAGQDGYAFSKCLQPKETSYQLLQNMTVSMFAKATKLVLAIDETILRKIFSAYMQGTGRHFDSKIGHRIIAYKLIVAVITDGHYVMPVFAEYLFTPELIEQMEQKPLSKEGLIKNLISLAHALFPSKHIIIAADGAFASKNFLAWCIDTKLHAEVRMASNRKVMYKGESFKLKELLELKGIRPKGRKMARTISVTWHDIPLEITIVRRIDKKGNESIVFQAATYKALPREHVAHYQMRWGIETMFRTAKQSLGLQECFSTNLSTQGNHVAAVFLAYGLAQLEMKNHRLNNAEEAIRRCKMKNASYQIDRFANQIRSLVPAEA